MHSMRRRPRWGRVRYRHRQVGFRGACCLHAEAYMVGIAVTSVCRHVRWRLGSKSGPWGLATSAPPWPASPVSIALAAQSLASTGRAVSKLRVVRYILSCAAFSGVVWMICQVQRLRCGVVSVEPRKLCSRLRPVCRMIVRGSTTSLRTSFLVAFLALLQVMLWCWCTGMFQCETMVLAFYLLGALASWQVWLSQSVDRLVRRRVSFLSEASVGRRLAVLFRCLHCQRPEVYVRRRLPI
jgi:hypothetical protein